MREPEARKEYFKVLCIFIFRKIMDLWFDANTVLKFEYVSEI